MTGEGASSVSLPHSLHTNVDRVTVMFNVVEALHKVFIEET